MQASAPGFLRLSRSTVLFTPSRRLKRLGKLASRFTGADSDSDPTLDLGGPSGDDDASLASGGTGSTAMARQQGEVQIAVDEIASVRKETRMRAFEGLVVTTREGKVRRSPLRLAFLLPLRASLKLTARCTGHRSGASPTSPGATQRSTSSSRSRRRGGSRLEPRSSSSVASSRLDVRPVAISARLLLAQRALREREWSRAGESPFARFRAALAGPLLELPVT